jgi:serine/threonine protein kinase
VAKPSDSQVDVMTFIRNEEPKKATGGIEEESVIVDATVISESSPLGPPLAPHGSAKPPLPPVHVEMTVTGASPFAQQESTVAQQPSPLSKVPAVPSMDMGVAPTTNPFAMRPMAVQAMKLPPVAAQHAPVPPPAAVPAPMPAAAKPAPAPIQLSQQKPPTNPPASPSAITGADKEQTQSETAAKAPQVGTRIHHYEIIRRIGRGGMGAVYLARDTRLGRRVAIKFLHTQSAELTKRFILEARTTASLGHENIVIIYEVDAWSGSPFMVFEFIQGKTLSAIVPDDAGPLPPGRAVELMVPVVRALAYAHSQGIVHRDLKPDNVMITDSGITKVLDFGIAKVLQGDENAKAEVTRPRAPKSSLEDEDDSALTHYGAMMGTLAYMAPEQWGIGVPIDHRSDIWAVGIMLFKMLSGKHPLDPLRGQQLMVTGMLNDPMPLLKTKAPDVPQALADAVDKCLLKHKDKRWPDAVALLRALEPFLPGRYTRELKIDESPYAGLASFQENDADRFFGRGQEIASMVNRVRERPLLGIVGPSGAGKSSFVRAGLLPALKRSGEKWDSHVLRPGRDPLTALAALINPMLSTSASVADDLSEQKKLAERLKTEPGFAGAVLRSKARRDKNKLLIFVDQFEELYTLVPDAADRKAFTASLSALADDSTSPIRLIISIRSDFLDRVPEDAHFMAELGQGLVFMNAPGVDGLRDAIIQPAELAGYKFETNAIVEDMLKHLASTPGALPLLQFCAQMLWENRDPAKKQLTQFAYEAIGGVGGALAVHADSFLQKLPPQLVPLARAILVRLVTPERTRAIVSLDELRDLQKDSGEVQRLIDELVQARLLVVQTGGGQATVEIVHESLINTWPTLKRWLEESGEDAAFVEQLRQAAKQWAQKGEDGDLLWRGELAEEASRFQRRYRGALTETQARFLDAVIRLMGAQSRRRRALTIGAVVFLSLLVAASAVALVVIQGARQAADKNASTAILAKKDAETALEKVKLKEQERAKAQAEAESNAAELSKKQQELVKALDDAQRAAEDAQNSEKKAVRNAFAAIQAKKSAEEAKQRVDAARRRVSELLDQETERSKKLEEQLGGSGVIDTLK